jgi:putative tryptophan/tyrosine transport system substrate-binding protein
MNRRTFVEKVSGALLGAASLARAQQTAKVRLLGILTAGTVSSDWVPFFEALRKLGWIEGQNLLIERLGAGGKAELVPGLAEELVQLRPDVIVTTGAVASLAAKKATTTIPIVSLTGDPVLIGLVTSMSRPGGNITGMSTVAPELAAKRLELLKELSPTATRVGELVDPANPYIKLIRKEDEQAYRALGMQPIFVDVANPTQLDSVIAEVARIRVDALIVRADPLFVSTRDEIARLALKHGLPTMAEGKLFVSAGCLASYAAKSGATGRNMADLVDKVLKGARPSDLPILQPTQFELVLNLKTAKALGVAIPQSLLLRADEVIQ